MCARHAKMRKRGSAIVQYPVKSIAQNLYTSSKFNRVNLYGHLLRKSGEMIRDQLRILYVLFLWVNQQDSYGNSATILFRKQYKTCNYYVSSYLSSTKPYLNIGFFLITYFTTIYRVIQRM